MIGTPAIETETELNIPLKQTDYPKVKFWNRGNWTAFQNVAKADKSKMVVRGRSRASKGINVMMLYIELEDSMPVDGDTANRIQDMAKSYWDGLGDNAPTSWGKAGLQVKSNYCRQMVKWFPNLRLFSRDWKASNIATDSYTGWYKAWQKKSGDIQEIEVSGGSQNKCSHKDSMKVMQKRTRIDDFVSNIQFYRSQTP
jgi:hypothetical protein